MLEEIYSILHCKPNRCVAYRFLWGRLVLAVFLSDVFIVVLLFSFLKMLTPASTLKVSLSVLVFSYLVEISEHFNLVEFLGVNNKVIRIFIGTHFDWLDLIAYTVGFFICLFVGIKS